MLCSTVPQKSPIAAVMPLSWEERMGRSVRGQVLALLGRNSRECAGPEGKAAIEALVNRLAATVEESFYLGRGGPPKRTRQIVLTGTIDDETGIDARWAIKKMS